MDSNVALNQVFEANGNKYYVSKSLTVERYKAYQKMQIEVGFGIGFAGVVNVLKKAYEQLNKQQFADAAVTLHNTLNSIAGLDEREHPVLVLCALFINRENEDLTKVDDSVLLAKIEDWKASGIPMDFFLGYAQHLVQDYQKLLSELGGKEIPDLLKELALLLQTKSE